MKKWKKEKPPGERNPEVFEGLESARRGERNSLFGGGAGESRRL
jgi:hypothetical protein